MRQNGCIMRQKRQYEFRPRRHKAHRGFRILSGSLASQIQETLSSAPGSVR